MGILKVIHLNRKIIQMFNSCQRKDFVELIDDIMKLPNPEKIFRKKYYVWNIIRPRDFYKNLAYYVVSLLDVKDANGSRVYDKETMDTAERLIKIVLETTPDEAIRKSFIWNIMKQIPLMTIDTIQYASSDKIKSLLLSDKQIIADPEIIPFLEVVKNLRDEITVLQAMVEQ